MVLRTSVLAAAPTSRRGLYVSTGCGESSRAQPAAVASDVANRRVQPASLRRATLLQVGAAPLVGKCGSEETRTIGHRWPKLEHKVSYARRTPSGMNAAARLGASVSPRCDEVNAPSRCETRRLTSTIRLSSQRHNSHEGPRIARRMHGARRRHEGKPEMERTRRKASGARRRERPDKARQSRGFSTME